MQIIIVVRIFGYLSYLRTIEAQIVFRKIKNAAGLPFYSSLSIKCCTPIVIGSISASNRFSLSLSFITILSSFGWQCPKEIYIKI